MTIVRTQFINRRNNRRMDRRGTDQLAVWLIDWMNRCEFTSNITYACPILSNVPILTLSQTSFDFYVSAVQVFWKHSGKRRNCSLRTISPFPTVFSTHLRTLCHFYQTWNCRLQTLLVWKSLKFAVWERVKLICLTSILEKHNLGQWLSMIATLKQNRNSDMVKAMQEYDTSTRNSNL